MSNRVEIGSFAWICQVLDFDVEAVRSRLLRMSSHAPWLSARSVPANSPVTPWEQFLLKMGVFLDNGENLIQSEQNEKDEKKREVIANSPSLLHFANFRSA